MIMSAPIAINVNHSASSSPSSSPRLYVPIHKRNGSNSSSSSRPSSPSSTSGKHFLATPLLGFYSYNATITDTPLSPSAYSIATLLSMQSLADESIKGKVHATCPEIVLSRRVRKTLEFHGRRTELSSAQQAPAAAAVVDTSATEINAQPTLPALTRVLPRRTRPATRAPERRRNALGSRRGLTTGDDSWRLQAIPITPALLV